MTTTNRTHRWALALGLTIALAQAPSRAAVADARGDNVVQRWNEIATDAIVLAGAHAPASSGVLIAIVQLAVYDAVVAIRGGYAPYAAPMAAPRNAAVAAAVAQAAHDVLIDLLPKQAAALDAQLASTLATVADRESKAAGIRVGRQAAAGILARRAGDGRFADVPYEYPNPVRGAYRATPPAFATPLVPWVARVRPFALTHPSQFRPGPPPPLDSDRWGKAYSRTKRYGDLESSGRRREEDEIAIFWTEHTARQWNRGLRRHAAQQGLDELPTARLLALTNTAMADAWIACWDAKYHYNVWRPVTAIRHGGPRSDTAAAPAWTPLQTTPNHPEYPAAHACVSTAASQALVRFFGRDEPDLTLDAVIDGKTLVHTFNRYSDAGREAQAARIYGGMHFEFSNEAGARIGERVVAWMVARGLFRPVGR